MIQLIGEKRHVSVTILSSGKWIYLRVKLKGTIQDERQQALRAIYNSYLSGNNGLVFSVQSHSRSIEVMGSKNGIARSVGFIPEEIARILWNHGTLQPEVHGMEVRKHLTEDGKPFFGAVVRLPTKVSSDHYMQLVKEVESSIMEGNTQEEYNGTRSITRIGPTPATREGETTIR